MIYELICEVDMTFLPSISDLVVELNNHMSAFGFDEKVGLSSTAPIGTITTKRELTDDEKNLLIYETQLFFDNHELLKKFRIVELKKADQLS